MKNSQNYLIVGDLTEKQIEADVAHYLGWCAEGAPFRLLDIDEQIFGADKKFDQCSLIYLQFKKSKGLRPLSFGKMHLRKNADYLHEIRKYRNQEGLYDTPSLFFKLHPKAKNAIELQHNIPFKYNLPPHSHANYVAPLLLDKEQYHQALFSSSRFLMSPFVYHPFIQINAQHAMHKMKMIPYLREHISIPPHELVSGDNHYYAFSETGTDVSWHSPTVIQREPMRLSDFIYERFAGIFRRDGEMADFRLLVKRISEILTSYGESPEQILTGQNDFERIRQHGKWLLETHSIRQFLLLTNKEEIYTISK